MDSQSLAYRPCVGIVLLNANNQVFVGERIDNPGAWQMPQGGVDDNETIEIAALRELAEEIGTDNATIVKVAEEKLRYDIPQETLERLPWGNTYCGQEQTWVAMRFTGNDTDIDLNAHSEPEFSAWKWVNLNETLDLIVPFKRKTYQRVINLFEHLLID